MKESTEKLAQRLKETQEFCGEVGEYLEKNFYVEGKTMKQWKQYFKIDIPDDITFPVVIKLASKIWMKYQRAAYFRDKQQVQLAIMEQTKHEKYHQEYQRARTENEKKFNKPLAAESCKVAATLAIGDLENAIANQKVVHSFWVKTCDTLTEMRKLLELTGYALSGDARVQRDVVIRGDGGAN
jgi:hypothetical protein